MLDILVGGGGYVGLSAAVSITGSSGVNLITGGSGCFGRAFTQRLLDLNVERICIFSRGEHHQAEMRQDFGDDPRLRWFIGDVRDEDRLTRAAQSVAAIVHAAALNDETEVRLADGELGDDGGGAAGARAFV